MTEHMNAAGELLILAAVIYVALREVQRRFRNGEKRGPR
jgi:hypothetical protein